jgi:hypothetical protein
VINWSIDANGAGYYFLKFQPGGPEGGLNGKWLVSENVSAFASNLQVIGSLSLSVAGTSFHAVASFNASFQNEVATYSGTLTSGCSVGITNPLGTWVDNLPRATQEGQVFSATPTFAQTSDKYDISGTVTGPGGKPVVGVVIDVRDANGVLVASATTDGDGHYQTIELDPATYLVAPATDRKAFSPNALQVSLVSSSATVNFTKGCPSGPPTPSTTRTGLPAGTGSNGPRRADAALTHAASSAACLQVYIKIVGPIPNVGTRSGLSVDNYAPDDGPVNFTKLTGSVAATPLVGAASTGQQCVSGCANILITVVNKVTHQPATNAEVNVELGAIDTGKAPALYQQGTQFLCLQADGPVQHCGTSLDGLKTDDKGHVRLLYWAPGELVSAHVELYAQACTASACALKRAKSKITVYPYRIFHYQGELSPKTVQDLVEMVQSARHFDIISHAAEFGLEAAVKAWMELLSVESHVVELVLGPIGFLVAFTVIDLAHATSELLEEAELRGAFFDASGLSEAGLKTSAFAKVLAPGDANYFESQVLDGGKLFTLGSGWLWELAEQLAKEYGCCAYRTQTSLFKPEPLDLSVYETSYCSQYSNQEFHSMGEEAHCGPGYGSLHSPNITTDLCISISQLGKPTCGIQYDAPIWVVSQEGVDKDLHHPAALDTSLP